MSELDPFQRAQLERFNRAHRWKDRLRFVGAAAFVIFAALFLIFFFALILANIIAFFID